MKKSKFLMLTISLLALLMTSCGDRSKPPETGPKIMAEPEQNQVKSSPVEHMEIQRLLSGKDQDKDGLDDLDDILQGARAEVKRKPKYLNAYYSGGYPPESEGVCTDVIWRAFRDAGYNLKAIVDQDIRNNLHHYPRINGKPEPNIDFRRVPNLVAFFKRHATSLTKEIIPNDPENLKQWQGGDIVVYGAPLWHIGVVSTTRRPDGVPLLIHNGGPYAMENDMLLDWPSPIIYHFRFPPSKPIEEG